MHISMNKIPPRKALLALLGALLVAMFILPGTIFGSDWRTTTTATQMTSCGVASLGELANGTATRSSWSSECDALSRTHWGAYHDYIGTETTAIISDLTERASYAEGTSPWSASGTGSAAANKDPVIDGPATVTLEVKENEDSGTNIGDAFTATDEDGDAITWSLDGTDKDLFAISSAGQLSTAAALDHEASATRSITVQASDGNGGTDTVTVTVSVTDVRLTPDKANDYDENNNEKIEEIEARKALRDYIFDGELTENEALAILGLFHCSDGTAVPDPESNPGLVGDCEQLMAAKETLRGSATLNWDGNLAITSWQGVTLSGSPQRVTTLDLSSLGLTGSIPTELGSLSNLSRLYLSGNQLTGSIPTELSSLSNLTVLWLYSNQLTGTIPKDLGSLSNLTELYLDSNQLTGNIPAELGSLSKLKQLDLRSNQLTGSIPKELSSLSNLTSLKLTGNSLTGCVPADLWDDSSIGGDFRTLGLPKCQCSNGTVVPSPESNPGLVEDCEQLMAAKDALRGTAALNWDGNLAITGWQGVTLSGSPQRVSRVNLSSLGLTGSIPTELGSLTELTNLNLHTNRLTGSIPAELGSLSNLTHLYLYGNRLTGSIPVELGSLSQLTRLGLHGNKLTGNIPAELGALTKLTRLNVSDNRLTGEVPSEWGSLTSLTHLYLSGNALTGDIPTELGSLSSLTHFYLRGNALTGNIPTELGLLSSLTHLYLDDNALTGSIPVELGSLSQLGNLYLAENALSGCIPAALKSVSSSDLADTGLSYCAADGS